MAASLLKETGHIANEVNLRKHGETVSVVLLHYLYVLVRKTNDLYVQETPAVILYEARHFEVCLYTNLLHVFIYGLTNQETPNFIPLRLANSHTSHSCNSHAPRRMRLLQLTAIHYVKETRLHMGKSKVCLDFFSHDLLM